MKNNKKACVMCSNSRFSNLKLCKDCQRVRDFIRLYGIKILMDFIEQTKVDIDKINFVDKKICFPSAPSY